MSETQIRNVNELQFTIVAEVREYVVEFSIFDIEGWDDRDSPGDYSSPLWHRAGAASHPDTVDELALAEPYLHGSVKWDGCSNWHFDEQDRVMLHGCTRDDVKRFGDVLAYCWDWAAEICPAWNA